MTADISENKSIQSTLYKKIEINVSLCASDRSSCYTHTYELLIRF